MRPGSRSLLPCPSPVGMSEWSRMRSRSAHRALDLHAPDGPCVRAHSVVRHCLEVVECIVDAFYATVLGGGQLREVLAYIADTTSLRVYVLA